MDGFNHMTLNAGIAAHDPLPVTPLCRKTPTNSPSTRIAGTYTTKLIIPQPQNHAELRLLFPSRRPIFLRLCIRMRFLVGVPRRPTIRGGGTHCVSWHMTCPLRDGDRCGTEAHQILLCGFPFISSSLDLGGQR